MGSVDNLLKKLDYVWIDGESSGGEGEGGRHPETLSF